MDTLSYRGITLASVSYKLYCGVLNSRLTYKLDDIDFLCDEQNSKKSMALLYAITAAEVLLREETIYDGKCLVCDDMTDEKQACPTCNHISHNKCFNVTSDQCYSCHAIGEQRTLSENQTPHHAFFKNKDNKNDAKNYRGITITPTLSKIIETVLKFLINPKIICLQNPLQRGITRNASPLYCSLIMEEFQRKNKDL
ncbi:unnamed protein product [Mytilus coruscus]|uniref:Phorbol-ester/DAG-type domain-containing protein n=1 Tax=Mytilus coruscus TaxID=42192 RepID=A0A6J8DJW8_MYTCO|nr:unnamed protein product [Mytilus coruscus]